jgi:hypothetical protein
MRGMSRGCGYALAVCLVICLAGMRATAEPIKLAVDAKSDYVILIGANANVTERFAAEELQKYLGKIIGAKLPIVTEAGKSPFVAVGDISGLNVPSRWEGDDGFRIRTVGSNILLKGAIPRGTLYAVYDFLERLGWRWFSPAVESMKGHSEYVPSKPTLAVEPIDALEQPLMKYRKRDPGGYYLPNSFDLVIEFMGKSRSNTIALHTETYEADRDQIKRELEKRGLRLEVGKHGIMPQLLPKKKYFAAHPEWFGMIDGKRTDQGGVVFETTNPEAVATFANNLVAYLKTRPEVDAYQIWPPDGCRWSQSPESLAAGSPSELMARLVQDVSKVVKAAGIKTKIMFIAYQQIIEPPKNMAFDKDIIVDFCPITRDYSMPLDDRRSKENVRLNKALLGWTKTFPGEVVHYTYYSKGSWSSLPVAEPEQIASDMKYWHEVGEVGTNIYCQPNDWLAREVHHIAFAKASWDASFDAAKWYDEYLAMRFGAAADAMKRYYRAATQVSLKGLIVQSAKGKPSDYMGLLAEARQAMAEAVAKADTPDAKWATKILSWQPDYLADALALKQARLDKKPKAEIDAAQKKLVELFNSHIGDGSASGKAVRP